MTTLPEIYEQKLASGAFAADEGQRRAVGALTALSESLSGNAPAFFLRFFRKTPAAPKGLYLHGGVGRGKSMLMDMFFAAAPVEKKRRVHFHAFMLEVHDFMHERRTAREKGEQAQRAGAKNKQGVDGDLIAAADKIAAEARLLCFDEFQVKDVADAMILGRLFTELFERGVVAVITSNIAPDDLYADGLQRDRFLPFIDLLKTKLDILHFTGEIDYRLRRLRELQVYFWPHDADAHKELDKIFRAVSDDEAGAPLDISVKGRIIAVPRAAKGVAAFTFAELCEQPKSAVDYLELSKRFRVFIVENIPKLDDARRDAVLRFVTLVDTLYDSHARLAVSAAAPPEKLYTGTEHAGVFGRTVSRLMEMQSRAYRDQT